jgi:hypothetical protein
MTTPTQSSDNTVLALVPPQIPSGTAPVEGAIYGVPLHIYDLDPMGLQVRVLSYFGQQKGDTIWLNLNGQLRIVSEQTQSDSDDVTLRLPHQHLQPNRVNELTYTVTRNSDNVATSTPVLTLLYNEIRPGNEDQNPGDRQHSELELLLPDALKNGVGPDFVSATVCVRYPYCRAYDKIRLNCNGYDVFYTVTTDDAPGPPNPGSSTPTTVCFTVTRADLERAKDHPQFRFSFTVTDQLLNTTDPESLFSAVQIVDVDLAGKRFAKPIPLENLDDYPVDDPDVIDLRKMVKQPLSLYVKTDDSRIQVGDRIEAVYTATSNGQPDIVETVSGTVEGKLGQKLPCVLEVANDKVISGYSVTLAYKVFRGATLIGESRVAYAKVVGENTVDIAPPTLVAPVTNPVDPLSYPSGVQVQVTFASALPDDKAQLFLLNPFPGSPALPVLSLAQMFAIFTLDVAFLNQWHGKAPQLGWKLIRGGQVIAESLPLVLTMLPILSGDPRLPTPKILQAANGGDGPELDVSKLTAGARVQCLVWPLIAFGQPVWLHLRGKNTSGGVHDITLLRHPTNAVHQAWLNAGYYNVSVPYSYLKDLGNGSDLEVWFTAALDKGTDESKAVRFSVRPYTVKTPVDEKPVVHDPSPLILDGRNYSLVNSGLIFTRTGYDPAGTAGQKTVTGGFLPYSYKTSHSNIASVDERTGLVRSEGNGTATITVTDARQSSVSYTVITSNVRTVLVSKSILTFPQILEWIPSVGGSIISDHIAGEMVDFLPRKYFVPASNYSDPNAACMRTGEWTYGSATPLRTSNILPRPEGGPQTDMFDTFGRVDDSPGNPSLGICLER